MSIHPVLPGQVVRERRAHLLLVDPERTNPHILAKPLEREVNLVQHVLGLQAVLAHDDDEVRAARDGVNDG